MSAPYAEYVDALRTQRLSRGEAASAADQLLCLGAIAADRPEGRFLELGTGHGQATKVILNALHGQAGHLVSVDVDDFSASGAGPNWTFVQTSSTDLDAIFDAAPALRDGIDLIYVDSLHTVAHVYQEIMLWFPYLKPGGVMAFDDIDPTPYMRGHRKDSTRKEVANRAIGSLVTDLFYGNLDSLRMEVKLGSTGLALWTKTSRLGDTLEPYTPRTSPRTDRGLGDLDDAVRGHAEYKNSRTDQSMLIPLPKGTS